LSSPVGKIFSGKPYSKYEGMVAENPEGLIIGGGLAGLWCAPASP
jgi:hypothetical protein